MKTIGLLAFPECLTSQLFGLRDAFAVAARVAELQGLHAVDVRLISADKSTVVLDNDLLVKCSTDTDDLDVLIVPGFYLHRGAEIPRRLAELSAEIRLIKQCHQRGCQIATLCVSAMLAAEAGLLDNQTCTTAWYYSDSMQRRYPSINVSDTKVICEAGQVITSGARQAWADVFITLLARIYNESVARATRQLLLQDAPRASQAPYIDYQLSRIKQDSFADKIEAILEQDIAAPYDLDALANTMQVSARTVLRKYKQARGISPLRYLQAKRIQFARAELERTDAAIEDIALRCGYRDISAFRTLFIRETAVPPGTYRRQVTQHQV